MLSQQPDHQHSQDAEQGRRESQREVVGAEDPQRDEGKVIERRAVIVFRVVFVLAAFGQVEWKWDITPSSWWNGLMPIWLKRSQAATITARVKTITQTSFSYPLQVLSAALLFNSTFFI